MHKKNPLNLRDLISFIDLSISEKTLEKDYPDYLNGCKDLGISSYVLNLLIEKAHFNIKNKKKESNILDTDFFVAKRDQKEKVFIEKKIEIKVYRWGWKTWTLFLFFSTTLLVASYIIVKNPTIWYHLKNTFL